MLYEFLKKNQEEILNITEKKTIELAGDRSSSTQLESGLPIFFEQLLDVLLLEREEGKIYANESDKVHSRNKAQMVKAASESDETSDLNRCLDIAIAGAVTGFSLDQNTQEANREVEHLGFLAHELRNALTSVNLAFQLIKKGTVATGGSTAQLIDKGLRRIEYLIDRSLTEVRMKIDPRVIIERGYLLQLVDQIITTASVEAQSREQTLNIKVDPKIIIKADQQLFYSAISNLIQNAIKYTHVGGTIEVRGNIIGQNIVIEVEDECGGLLTTNASDLFKPFEQQHKNKQGLGLGLTIAQRAIELNLGTIKAKNLPGKGCIFTITLPNHMV